MIGLPDLERISEKTQIELLGGGPSRIGGRHVCVGLVVRKKYPVRLM
jgi:hypothetical protein